MKKIARSSPVPVAKAGPYQGATVIITVTGGTDNTAYEMVNWMVCAEVTDPEGTEMTQLPPKAVSLYWLPDSDVDHEKFAIPLGTRASMAKEPPLCTT